MDCRQKLKIRSNVSRGEIEAAINCLNEKFITSKHRQHIVRLLKLITEQSGENIADMTLYTFEKSTYVLHIIPEDKKIWLDNC